MRISEQKWRGSNSQQPSRVRLRTQLLLERLEERVLLASDAVLAWNEQLMDVLQSSANTYRGPTWASRHAAMVQVAVFDAVNAITKSFNSFATAATAPATASKEAAVAAAAHDVLVGLFPNATTDLDAFYTQSLADIPDGPAEDAGVLVGQQVAAEVLALRANDNAGMPTSYTPGTLPGQWRPDPLNPAQVAISPEWGKVLPFALGSVNDVVVPPVPGPNTATYTSAFNEVKSLGAKNSVTRTADQTEIALFWAYDRPEMGTPVVLYNEVAQTIAMQQGNSLEANARLFALVNVAMADSGIVVWNAKYVNNFWRPITAIREANTDGNPATVADPNWEPLGAPTATPGVSFTPPFPAYPSGNAAFGTALFRVLRNFYGTDNISFSLTSDEMPGVTRSYTSFSQAVVENGRSRIFMGVHFAFDDTVSRTIGTQVADYVTGNFLIRKLPTSAELGVQMKGGGFHFVNLPAGVADVTIRKQGTLLQAVRNTSRTVFLSKPVANVNAVRFEAKNGARDLLTVDHGFGGAFALPGGLLYNGGPGENDRFWFNGTSAAESLTLDGQVATLPSVVATLNNITYVGLAGQSGDDTFTVRGTQTGNRVELYGAAGNDKFLLSPTNGTIFINEAVSGIDSLDFSASATGVKVDISLANSQTQSLGNGTTFLLFGTIENLTGSPLNDILRGNPLANKILGGSGNDRIYGRAGNDDLQGEGGNDVLVGGDGDDLLAGGAGFDVLIGGNGRDRLFGNGDENIFIGGSTTFDENDVALLAILDEWSSATSLATRIANLNGTGVGPRKNGNFFLKTTGTGATVRNDNVPDEFIGLLASNWFLPFAGDTRRDS